MFKISFSPQYSTSRLTIEKQAETLIVNGDELDFSGLPDGGEYPPEAIDNPSVVGGVSRVGGVINITVILPYWMLGVFETPAPITVEIDGPIALPGGCYPPPPEDLPLPDPEPIAEGEDNAAQ